MMTEMILSKIGLAHDKICKVCLEKKEGVLHLFLKCRMLSDFIEMLKKMVCDFLYNDKITLEEWDTLLLFGLMERQKISMLLILC